MIADKYIELIHREIDGRNSPQASAKLAAFLAANPQAQKLYDELQALSGMLQEVKPVEPPPHLPHMIMNRLPPSQPVRRSLFAPLQEWLEARGKFKYAYVFSGGLAAGLAAVAIFFQTARPTSEDLSKLSGAMIPREQVENLKTAESREIKHEQVTGVLHLKDSPEIMVVEFSLASMQEVELDVAFDEKNLAFKGVIAFAQSFPGEVNVRGSALELKHRGQQRYAVIFVKQKQAAGALHLKIGRAGEIFYHQTLMPGVDQ